MTMPEDDLTNDDPVTRRSPKHVGLRALVVRSRPFRSAVRRSKHVRHSRLLDRLRWWRRRPVTLNEKIRYKMAKDRRPLLTTFSDKLAVRDYVASRVDPDILNHVFLTAADPREIDVEQLPDPCVIKPTHGSGAVILVHDGADPSAVIPGVPDGAGWVSGTVSIRRDRIDQARFNSLADSWLSTDYGRTTSWAQWAYRDVPPRLIVERFLEGRDGAAPTEYKLMVFHGRVRWLYQVAIAAPRRLSLFWPDWTPIPATYGFAKHEDPPSAPRALEEMIAVAEALGSETDFVRVDLYDVDGRMIFGELTNYSQGGRGILDPPEYRTILADGWDPPARY
jgi:TupA-like ATPgrasp